LDLLRLGKIDLAVSLAPASFLEMELMPLFQDELLFAFSAQHPWAAGGPVPVDELKRQPMLLEPRSSVTSQMVHRYFAEQQIELNGLMEVANAGASAALVKLNVAVAVLPPWVFGDDLACGGVQLRPLGPRALKRQWQIVYRRGKRLNLLEEAFVKASKLEAQKLPLNRTSLATSGTSATQRGHPH
jgi:DNA-binding transcriptional LysR family regulator